MRIRSISIRAHESMGKTARATKVWLGRPAHAVASASAPTHESPLPFLGSL
ncbi:MAG: hypothetical protein NZ843_03365 [Fimbriimonadales bacterium]|nr:hypothetical protein [Fimbriimonadales bacterium]